VNGRRPPELIVALDVPSLADVDRTLARLGPAVGFYKIGLELFTASGPEAVRRVKAAGKRVFLDLKLHDIPRTVERAVRAAAALGVDMLTLHAAGGRAMVAAAREAAGAPGAGPLLVAVTVLTSLDAADLADQGLSRDPAVQAEVLGELAVSAGADGVVCSAAEAARLRATLGPHACLVTPGVRPAGVAAGDQKRVATPREAARNGATHVVVGRPILDAPDPAAAAAAIRAELLQGVA
jgi:orotidine-5'-phosphate decarboxylase